MTGPETNRSTWGAVPSVPFTVSVLQGSIDDPRHGSTSHPAAGDRRHGRSRVRLTANEDGRLSPFLLAGNDGLQCNGVTVSGVPHAAYQWGHDIPALARRIARADASEPLSRALLV